MNKKNGLVGEVVGCFAPQLNKLLGLIVFFYSSVIVINGILYWTLPPDTDRPQRLTDIFSDAGTLALGAYLGILKEKADSKRREEDETIDDVENYDGPLI